MLWNMIDPLLSISQHAKPVHLLWGLMLLKLYDNESVNCSTAGVDETTFRKWSWVFVEAISDLEHQLVSSNRNN
jgi:hypothetical protein